MLNRLFNQIHNCRICNSPDLFDFLALGELPLPNSFIERKHLQRKEKRFPLGATYCNACGLVQLTHIVNPEIMFKNYLYIPSSSNTRISHFRNMAMEIKKTINLNSSSLVVDVGSNDGSLLNCFKNLGIRVLGVDPAENLVKVAELNGIKTILGYFNAGIAKKIAKNKKAEVVLATNVLAHVDNLRNFFSALEILLENNGIFVCQFPYLLDLIKKNQFDTIYHEHLSYFSLNPLLKLADDSKLEIFDLQRNNLDGGSLRLFFKKKRNKSLKINKKAIENLLSIEKKEKLYEKSTYVSFAKRLSYLKHDVRKKLMDIKRKNRTIIGYGAAAKGNIFLNYFDIGPEILEYIVDSTSYKQGLYTPGKNIPIYDESRIYQTKPDYILILAWNFKEEIIAKNKEYKKMGGKFITVIPEFEIL